MTVFICQGRFTQSAVREMLAKPEDRAEAIGQLFSKVGGKLLAYYMTCGGDYDFMTISEGSPESMEAAKIVATAGGGVTDLKTMVAMTSSDMKNAFAKAGSVAASFRPAGATS